MRFCIERPDTGRAKDLVPREDEEVRIQSLDIDWQMRGRLGTIHEHMHPVGVCVLDDLFNGIDGSQGIGDLGDADKLCPWTQQSHIFLEDQLPPVIDRHHLEHGTDLPGKKLPGDDVGMVLQRGKQDFVTGTDKLLAEGVGNKVDCLGRSSSEDNFVLVPCSEELPHFFTGVLECRSGPLSQLIGCTVDVGVVLGVKVGGGINDRLRLLGGGRIVQEDKGVSVHLLLKRREIPPCRLHVKGGDGGGQPALSLVSGSGHR